MIVHKFIDQSQNLELSGESVHPLADRATRRIVGFTYRQSCCYSNPRHHILCSAPIEHYLAHGLVLYGMDRMVNHESRLRRLSAFVVSGRCRDIKGNVEAMRGIFQTTNDCMVDFCFMPKVN